MTTNSPALNSAATLPAQITGSCVRNMPIECVACHRPIGPAATHYLTSTGYAVCYRSTCLSTKTQEQLHTQLYPTCPARHEVFDHPGGIAADRQCAWSYLRRLALRANGGAS